MTELVRGYVPPEEVLATHSERVGVVPARGRRVGTERQWKGTQKQWNGTERHSEKALKGINTGLAREGAERC